MKINPLTDLLFITFKRSCAESVSEELSQGLNWRETKTEPKGGKDDRAPCRRHF